MTRGWIPAIFMLICLLATADVAAGQLGPAASSGGMSRIEVDLSTDASIVMGHAVVTLYQGFTQSPVATLSQQGDLATFEGLPGGQYVVEVTAPGYQPFQETIQVTGDNTVFRVSASLQPLHNVRASDDLSPLLAPDARKELEQGHAALKANNFAEARKHLDAAYKLAPGDPNVNFLVGMLALRTHDLNQAQNCFLKTTSLDPGHVPALLALGEVRLEEKDYAAAAQPLETAVSVAPKNWVAHWLLATTELAQQQFESARREAKQAVRLGKLAASGAQFVEGEALAGLGLHDRALKTLQAFVRKAPNDPQAPAARVMIAQLRTSAP